MIATKDHDHAQSSAVFMYIIVCVYCDFFSLYNHYSYNCYLSVIRRIGVIKQSVCMFAGAIEEFEKVTALQDDYIPAIKGKIYQFICQKGTSSVCKDSLFDIYVPYPFITFSHRPVVMFVAFFLTYPQNLTC